MFDISLGPASMLRLAWVWRAKIFGLADQFDISAAEPGPLLHGWGISFLRYQT